MPQLLDDRALVTELIVRNLAEIWSHGADLTVSKRGALAEWRRSPATLAEATSKLPQAVMAVIVARAIASALPTNSAPLSPETE